MNSHRKNNFNFESTDAFLPTTIEELRKKGISNVDFVLVTGDAYVDHPSFGSALIGRLLEKHGFTVAVLAQPDWKSSLPFKEFGKPRLGFLVTGGNLDSMLNNYTAAKKPRREDAYSPGGIGGRRPDRAVTVYSNRIREAYRGVPIIIGGIEASLRRLIHYDYWDNKLRRSVVFDSRADLLVYGMAERSLLEVVRRLRDGESIREIRDVAGTAFIVSEDEAPGVGAVELPSWEEHLSDKKVLAEAFRLAEREQNPHSGRILVQKHGDRCIVVNPPALPLDIHEMDEIYDLPYARNWHPSYDVYGGVPAIREVQFSITSHRGCYGGCSFCALTFHQGKVISARSAGSIVEEAKKLVNLPSFKGYIHDVGGPTANFRVSACDKMKRKGACPDRNCLGEDPCKKISPSHEEYLEILRKVRDLPGIKKVFIRSGLRYDYMMLDKSDEFFRELCEHHISGQLKVAPEHVSSGVLSLMGKPGFDVFLRFREKYFRINREIKKDQYLVPYLMSSHPGSTLDDAIEMAEAIRDLGGTMPEQVQDFIPTPGSMSTVMYYSEIHPYTKKKVYVPRTPEEKAMQRALIQYMKPENRRLVEKALRLAGRGDLIGNSKKALIRETGSGASRDTRSRKEAEYTGPGNRKSTIRGNNKIKNKEKSGNSKAKGDKPDKSEGPVRGGRRKRNMRSSVRG